jgi:SGNH domain (fused to AT3 domains)
MPCRFWELSLGCITFLVLQSGKQLPKVFVSFANPLLITGLLIGVLCIPQVATWRLTIGEVLLTSLLIIALNNNNSSVYKAFTWKPVLFVGRISYSLYLWHWSVLSTSRWTIGVSWLTFPIQLGLITLLAFISYKYIEQPLRFSEWSQSRGKTIGYGLITSLACVCLLFGLGNPLKGRLYTGKEATLIKKGVETLTDDNYWNGKVAWSGEKCTLNVKDDQWPTLPKTIKPEFCTFGSLSEKGTHFLVIGNSLSAAEIEMTKVLAEKGLGTVTVTSSFGASPVKEIPNDSSWRKANTYYWSSVVPSLISNLREGDIVIMINDMSGFAPQIQTQQSKENLKILHDGLINFARQLDKKSIGLVFQSVNPFLRDSGCVPDVSVTDISVRRLLPFKGIGACNYFTKTDSLTRRAPVQNLLTDIEKTNRNFKVLDLFNVLCPDTECSYLAQGNKFMYRDVFSHLSVEASVLSQPQLLEAVMELRSKLNSSE